MTVQNTSNLLDGPGQDAPRPDGPELKKCAQCGRIGIRRFTTYPAHHGMSPLTVCTAKTACRRRWPNTTTAAEGAGA